MLLTASGSGFQNWTLRLWHQINPNFRQVFKGKSLPGFFNGFPLSSTYLPDPSPSGGKVQNSNFTMMLWKKKQFELPLLFKEGWLFLVVISLALIKKATFLRKILILHFFYFSRETMSGRDTSTYKQMWYLLPLRSSTNQFTRLGSNKMWTRSHLRAKLAPLRATRRRLGMYFRRHGTIQTWREQHLWHQLAEKSS